MKMNVLGVSPVLPSQDIERDVNWYSAFAGFELVHKDDLYAVLKRDRISIHLQWHADTNDDPLLGGSVVKIFVKQVKPVFEDFIERRTVSPDSLRLHTAWGTHEFGFYDLNKNAIFFVEDL